mgnify:CR=1 FL=1
MTNVITIYVLKMALEILLETALVPPITRLSEIPINLCHFKAQMETSDEPKFQSI